MKNSKNCWTVYRHITPDGKSYIGKTSQRPKKRWKNGKGYKGTLFSGAIQKFGWDKIEHEILDTNLDEFEAKCLEEYYILSYRTFIGFSDCNGYNMSLGEGTTGWQPTNETREKISESNKGKTQHKGFHHSEETKKRISDFHKGNQYRKGKHHSEETKKRISESHKGKTNSPETRKRISEGLKGNQCHKGITAYNKGKHLVMIDGKIHYE